MALPAMGAPLRGGAREGAGVRGGGWMPPGRPGRRYRRDRDVVPLSRRKGRAMADFTPWRAGRGGGSGGGGDGGGGAAPGEGGVSGRGGERRRRRRGGGARRRGRRGACRGAGGGRGRP